MPKYIWCYPLHTLGLVMHILDLKWTPRGVMGNIKMCQVGIWTPFLSPLWKHEATLAPRFLMLSPYLNLKKKGLNRAMTSLGWSITSVGLCRIEHIFEWILKGQRVHFFSQILYSIFINFLKFYLVFNEIFIQYSTTLAT